MSQTFSHIIPDMNWKEAVRDAKRRVKHHALAGRGLGFICAAPNCDNYDTLLEFEHPKTGHKMHLCLLHHRMAMYEMRHLEYTQKTTLSVIMGLAKRHGGNLRFASLGSTIGKVPA